MTTLEGRLTSSARHRSDKAVRVRFELTNHGERDLYVLAWYTPLEGLFNDCLRVLRDGERVPYDGPLVKRGDPTAESYVLVPAGETVSKTFDLGEAYEVSLPGSYEVTLNTEVRYLLAATPSGRPRRPGGRRRGRKRRLRGGGARFNVVRGKGRRRLTSGEAARRASRRQRPAAEEDDDLRGFERVAGPLAPNIKDATPDQRALLMQAHQAAYGLCVNALAVLANDAHYKLWFGQHTPQRFQNVRDNFARIRNKMETQVFVYKVAGTECLNGASAQTHNNTFVIKVCDPFWDLPAAGPDSRASTVLHEHTHSSAGTGDDARNQPACQALARVSPDGALRNASNYEYFAS